MYCDIAAYSVFLQHNNYITILRLIQCTIVLEEARALHPMRTGLPCTQSCSFQIAQIRLFGRLPM